MPFPRPAPIFVYGLHGAGSKVFMPEPRDGKEATRWILTDACVVLVTCSACGAKPMQLCRFDSGKRCVTTHWSRRAAIRGMSLEVRLLRAKAILEDWEASQVAPEEHW